MSGLGLDTPANRRSGSSRTSSMNASSLRSASSMKGLLQAENGEAMVELDAGNGTSGFKQGSRIIPESLSSCPSSLCSSGLSSSDIGPEWSPEKASLSRHGTLLSTNATPSRNAAELKSVLGNANARLKPGASLVPIGALSSVESTSLEQAKLRARVEVDVIPETNIFVQGGYLNGTVKIRIRERLRKESGVLISDGKLRVVGFECIQNEEKRHTFYQQSVFLSSVSPTSESLYDSPPDNEGFYAAREGVHVLPFSMYLALEGGEGAPKGTIGRSHGGIAVRYILMISIKLKEIETDRRSIAHFYRDCEIWPRLNPSAILAPAAQPIRESAAKSLFMGGSGKVGLTASLHRLYWVAGQQCCVKIRVINKSKKTIKSLSLTLVRSTVTYKPKPSLDVAESDEHEHDADACQTSTTLKQVGESILEMGQRDPTRGHAGAKGWWTGVRPEETREFCHFLSLPSDAISIPRARLLEVAYNIRVTISAGPLSSDLHVLLPIRIISFFSVDPPPSFPPEDQSLLEFLGQDLPPEIQDITEEENENDYDYALPSRTLNGRMLGSLEEDDTTDVGYDDDHNSDSRVDTDNESASGCCSSISEDLDASHVAAHSTRQLGNASASDDNDDFVQQAITSLKVDNKYGERGGRFADLYYSSSSMPQGNSGLGACEIEAGPSEGASEHDEYLLATTASASTPRPPPLNESRLSSPYCSTSSIADSARSTRPPRLRGPSSFAERVEQKKQQAAAAKEDDSPLSTVDSSTSSSSHDSDTPELIVEGSGSSPSPIPLVLSPESHYVDHAKANTSLKSTPPSQGSGAGMGRKRSSTTGSYFRPREEIPDDIEDLNGDGPPSSPFPETRRKACEVSPLSVISGSGSKAGTGTGSRMLPIPPESILSSIVSNTGLTPSFDSTDTQTKDIVSVLPPQILSRDAIIEDTEDNNAITKTPKPEPKPISTTVRVRSRTFSSTPTHLKGTSTPTIIDQDPPIISKIQTGGNSVRDKIRMLEEKARVGGAD